MTRFTFVRGDRPIHCVPIKRDKADWLKSDRNSLVSIDERGDRSYKVQQGGSHAVRLSKVLVLRGDCASNLFTRATLNI